MNKESKTIVYPTDFTICAENALDYAIAMAKSLNGKIKTVHFLDVFETMRHNDNPIRVMKEFEFLKIKTIRRLKNRNEEILDKGIPCEFEILQTGRFSWLTSYINEVAPKVVVMGTQGSQVVKNKIMGSQTYKVIKNCHFPTLAVPKMAVYRDIKKIIFATDYRQNDSQRLEFIVKIAEHFKASVDVIHLYENSFDEKSYEIKMNNLKESIFKKVDYRAIEFKLFNSTNIAESIDVLAQESGADLLALVCRKRGFFDGLFSKSLTKRMVYHTHTPMLVF
ncbi:MAG: universal stress protein [Bacteroidota bacterium]